MGERFEVGDMVECVDASLARGVIQLELGELYTITGYSAGIDWNTRQPASGVTVDKAPVPAGCFWHTSRFRRVYRPDSTLIVTLLSQPVLEDA